MNTHQVHKLDSLERVQSFLDAHQELSGLKGTIMRAQLDAAVSAIGTQRAVQGSTTLQLQGAATQVKSLAEQLRTQHMEPIAKYARVRLKGVPNISALTLSVRGLTGVKLVAKARDMAAAAEPYASDLTQAQFPADAIAQLQQAANSLEAALKDRSDAKRSRTGSTAGVKQQLVAGRDAVAMLDAVVRRTVAGNAVLLAEWRQAKRITLKGVQSATPAATTPAASAPTTAAAASQPTTQEVKAA